MESEVLGLNATIVMGQSPPGATCNASGNGLPLLNGPTEFGPHHPTPVQFTIDTRKRALPGDILFCVRGSTTGRMNWADREYAIGRGVAAIRHKNRPELQPFVRAVIEFGLPGLLAQATGSTFPNVSLSQLAELWWPPIDESEQRAIARILGSLDDKIELNRCMNQTLEEMVRAIFKSWFVDFDPVHAKADGRAPVGMDAETAALFPDGFEDSELGDVPRGWKVISVSHVAKIVKGRSYKSSELAPSSTALVTLKSIERGGGYRSDGLKSFTGEYKPDQVVKPGEMVVACTDVTQAAEVIGKPAIVRNDPNFDTLVGSLDLAIVRPKVSYIGIPFIYLLFLGEDFQNHIYGHTNGTTVLHLDKNGIPSYEFVCPPATILQCFHDISSPIFQKIEINERQSRTLSALRDTLLPKLISGEIRVKDAKKLVKA